MNRRAETLPLPPPWRLRWFRRLLAAELLIAALVAGGLALMRAQALDAEGRMLLSLARAMALQADRTLGLGSAVLVTTREELRLGLIVPGHAATDALLRERLRALPGFRALGLFDPDGRRVAGSGADTVADAWSAARDAMDAARQARGAQLYLGQPRPMAPGAPALASLSVAWNDAAGHFRGVLALAADASYLEGGWQRIVDGAETALALHRADGTPVRTAVAAERRPPPLPAAWVRTLDRTAAGIVATVAVDGRPRLVAAAPLQQLPLWQVVSRDLDGVLAPWTELAGLVGALSVLLLALSTALALRSAREQLRAEGLEQRLARSRQLESLGQLAGGVAHDFNNVLAAVIGYGEMARQGVADGSHPARHLDQVLQAAARGRQQVARILAFSRGQPRRSVAFRLQPLVDEVLAHLAVATRPRLQLEPAPALPDAVVRGDPTATYEAVMNLCTNALQAMPDGGTLRVALQRDTLTVPRALLVATLPAGRYLRLSVRDSGSGIADAAQAHLFEPFFTTRAGQGGTGLGLAVVHGVVTDMGGGIDVVSARGRGTTVTLWLPEVDGPPDPVDEVPAEAPAGQGQSVLVVDDDPALVALAEELLAGLGYEPLGTASAADALDAVRRDPARFDLLLTDEVMPAMMGTALARAVHALRPDLPVVLVTGHAGADFEPRAAVAGIAEVLNKPLTRAELARALHRVLQRR